MRGLNIGGIEFRIINLTRELNNTGEYEGEIVTIMDKGALFDDTNQKGVPVSFIPIPHRSNIKGIMSLRSYIREKEFDIVHTHSFYPNVPGRIAAILARTPIIVAHQHSLFSRKCKQRKHRWYERLLAPFTDVIVSVSQSVKEDYCAYTGVSPYKVKVLHNGIDIKPFLQKYDTVSLRKELDLEDKVVIGCAGRLIWVKGYPVLIEAARKVVDVCPNAVFVIAGDGEESYKNKLIAQIESLHLQNHVRLLGYRKDVPALMQMFDIGALPSRFEGFPAVLIEFLASGKSIVATYTGGQSEIVKDGRNALLVPPESSDELAHALLRLIQDTSIRKQLEANARTTAEEFSLDKMVQRFDTLYTELMRQKKKL